METLYLARAIYAAFLMVFEYSVCKKYEWKYFPAIKAYIFAM